MRSKFLIFTSQFYEVGGYQRLATELAIELNRLDEKTDLLGLYSNKSPKIIKAEKKLKKNGIPNIYSLGLKIKPSFYSVLRAIVRFRKFVRLKSYSAIEVSAFTPALISSIALIGMNVKVIFGIHDIYDDREKIYFSFKYYLWKKILKFSKHVTFYAVSKAALKAWIKYLNIDSKRITIIPNSIHSSYFIEGMKKNKLKTILNKKIGISSQDKVVLFVGRTERKKGLDIVYNSLKTYLIPKKLHLVVVGKPDDTISETFLNNMRKEIQNSIWKDRIHFLGLRNDVPKIMAESDIILHPSRRESFGLVLAEGLAVGLPIVASNLDGIPEVLDGTESIIIKHEDPALYTNSVLSILDWSDEKIAIAAEKGKKQSQRFKTEIRTKSILNIFNSSL